MALGDKNAGLIADGLAREIGFTLTNAGQVNIVGILSALGEARGTTAFIEIDGASRPVSEWLQELAQSSPGYFEPLEEMKSKTTSTVKSMTKTEEAVTEIAAMRAKKRPPTMVSEIRGNPYRKGEINLTAQHLLEQHDPDRAERLLGEAGGAA